MYLIYRWELAASAAERWKKFYCGTYHWDQEFRGRTKAQVYQALRDLPDCPSPEKVNEVIGNNTWTDLTCNACDTRGLGRALRVKAVASDEYGLSTFCEACVRKMVWRFG